MSFHCINLTQIFAYLQCMEKNQQPTNGEDAAPYDHITKDVEVETELLIGMPERGPTRNLLQLQGW